MPDKRDAAAGDRGVRKISRLTGTTKGSNSQATASEQARFQIRAGLVRDGEIITRPCDRITVRWPDGTGAWLLASSIVVDDDLFARAA